MNLGPSGFEFVVTEDSPQPGPGKSIRNLEVYGFRSHPACCRVEVSIPTLPKVVDLIIRFGFLESFAFDYWSYHLYPSWAPLPSNKV